MCRISSRPWRKAAEATGHMTSFPVGRSGNNKHRPIWQCVWGFLMAMEAVDGEAEGMAVNGRAAESAIVLLGL